MGLLNSLFGGSKKRKSQNDKQQAMEQIGKMLDDAQAKISEGILKHLSSTDINERQEVAQLIQNEIFPALNDNPSLEGREFMKASVSLIIKEARVPKTESEQVCFDEMMFFYCKRKITNL